MPRQSAQMNPHQTQVESTPGLDPLSPELTLPKLRTNVAPATTPPSTPPPREIIDIRETTELASLKNEIVSMFLDAGPGEERALPTLLLYDAEGLKLFERITYEDEYYLTGVEIGILTQWAEKIAERIPDGGVVVELGSGNLRKVSILLNALSRSKKDITYYALDVSLPELERTLAQIPDTVSQNVTCLGLHGTYDDGLKWLSTDRQVKDKKKCILWLGSSIGNFDREEAANFLKNITETALDAGDMMLIGIDGCKSSDKVWRAYNDSHGVTHKFELNALKNANNILGTEVFSERDWDYVGIWNAEEGRHEAYFVALNDLVIDKAKFGKQGFLNVKLGERIRIERSYKFSQDEVMQVWDGAGLVEGAKWGCKTGDYHLHLVYKPPFGFPLSPEIYSKYPVPSLSEWRELWTAWDIATLTMIPKSQLLSKPIDLRNPCIFYLGHIPTFLDIHVARASGEPAVAPAKYSQIFERGIDPDVNDPEQCHRHSEIPDEWPALDEILDFVARIRKRVEGLYAGEKLRPHDGGAITAKKLKRALWMAFEHEAMHLETLMYMLLQSPSTQPPKGVVKPDWEAEAEQLKGVPDLWRNPWVQIRERGVTIGMNDREEDDMDMSPSEERHFGWDNEKPKRKTFVPAFHAKAAPISVGDYVDYLSSKSWNDGIPEDAQVPATWIRNETPRPSANTPEERILSSFSLRTFFGPLPLTNLYALTLPVVASYDELAACAEWLGGRIPTYEEVVSIYEQKAEEDLAMNQDSRTISAVNGQMNAYGVTETPPTQDKLFTKFGPEAQVGFRRWSWGAVRGSTLGLCGRGETGGAWEWTSTVLKQQEGFVKQREYPEYTSDFFDGKHNMVIGGSWATHPRFAGRKSFVNWYQRNYRFTWCTARLVRDNLD